MQMINKMSRPLTHHSLQSCHTSKHKTKTKRSTSSPNSRVPRFMALRALGRSRVMTATPFGCTEPRTKSSAAAAAAMASKLRRGEEKPRVSRKRVETNDDVPNMREAPTGLLITLPLEGGGGPANQSRLV